MFNSPLKEKKFLFAVSISQQKKKGSSTGYFISCIFQSPVSCNQGEYWKSRTLGMALEGEEG